MEYPNKNIEWEEEFRKKFTDKYDWIETEKVNERGYTYISPVRPDEVMTFIRSLLKSQSTDFERRLEEYRNSDDVWKNVGISKWKNWGDKQGYFTFLNSTGKLT